MGESSTTTAAIQQYLVDLPQAGHSSAGSLVRALLARSVERLRFLCSALLYRRLNRSLLLLTEAVADLRPLGHP